MIHQLSAELQDFGQKAFLNHSSTHTSYFCILAPQTLYRPSRNTGSSHFEIIGCHSFEPFTLKLPRSAAQRGPPHELTEIHQK